MVHPGDARFTNLERTWQNFGPEISEAAGAFGLPRAWLLAFATQETGHLSSSREKQRLAVSPANARGFLQILPGPGGPYPSVPADAYFDPITDAMLSAKFIREKLVARYGMNLPMLGAAYNAGSVRCSVGKNVFNFFAEHDYPRSLVIYNNSALQYLDLAPPFSLANALVWSAAGVVMLGSALLVNQEMGWFPSLPKVPVPRFAR